MILRFLSSICLAFPLFGLTQPLLEAVGGGVSIQGVRQMFSEEDGLLLCGSFTYAGGEMISPGIARWTGSQYEQIGCGVAWDCIQPMNPMGLANPVLSVAVWEDEIYVGGSIDFTRNDVHYQGLMKWNGADWEPVGGNTDGKVTSLRVINGQLIVAGWFVHAGDLEVNGLARWDGEQWHEVVPVPAFDPNASNYVNDVAFFQDQWYIGGNLNYVEELVRWTGSTWEIVGGGFAGSFAAVNELMVHDDKLYVAGNFGRCPPYGVPSNPGSGIVTWDGEAWDDLGGGSCGSLNFGVFGMQWWRDELYVCGRFDHMGGIEGSKLAKWNGEEWCMLLPPGAISNGQPIALAVHNDSLYVGGTFGEVGGEPVNYFTKWVGGDEVVGCGVLTGIGQEVTLPNALVIQPNPAFAGVTLANVPPDTRRVEVLDALGRCVLREGQRLAELDVSGLAQGTYQLQALDAAGAVLAWGRFVRQ